MFQFHFRLAILFLTVFLFSQLGMSAAPTSSSPMQVNPAFRGFVATMLVHQDRPLADRIEALDHYLDILDASLNAKKIGTHIKSLAQYRQLRDQNFSTPEEALENFSKFGLVTPLNIQANDNEVLEQIIDYEVTQLQLFKKFAETELPQTEGILGLQGALWNQLPALYDLGRGFREKTAEISGHLATKVFDKGTRTLDGGLKRGGLRGKFEVGLGLFAVVAGLGAEVVRGVGENIVNPIAREGILNLVGLPEIRRRAALEIAKLRQMSPANKAALFASFDSSLSGQMKKRASLAARDLLPALPEGLSSLPEVMTRKLIPNMIDDLSARQRSRLVWTLFNTPDFEKLDLVGQFRAASNAMGPMVPELLHWLGKNPNLANSALAPFLCCSNEDLQTDDQHLQFLADTLRENFLKLGWKLVSIEPQPLAVNPLKETYKVWINDGARDRAMVAQFLRKGAEAGLEEDLALLKRLGSRRVLTESLNSAGVPDFISTSALLEKLMLEESNLEKTAGKQNFAKLIYQRTKEVKLSGRRITVEIQVPTAFQSKAENKPVILQEFIEGMSLAEAATIDGPAANAALQVFAENYLSQALKPEGFVWGEPVPENFRVEFLDSGQKVRLSLINFGSSTAIDLDAMKAIYGSMARLPLRELLQSGPDAGAGDLAQTLSLVDQVLAAGVPINETSVRLGQGLMNLRQLIGEDQLKKISIKVVAQHPTFLWAPLGPYLSTKLGIIYEKLRTKIEESGQPHLNLKAAGVQLNPSPIKSCDTLFSPN